MVNTPTGSSRNSSNNASEEPSHETLASSRAGSEGRDSPRRSPRERRSAHNEALGGIPPRDSRRHTANADIHFGKFEIQNTWEAAAAYDFNAERGPNRKTTTVFESIGHLIKSCLGGGIVSIHESYKICGLWTALVLNSFLGLAVAYCMWVLGRSAQRMYGRTKVPKMTYPDLAQAALEVGPWPKMRRFGMCFRYLVDLTITLDLFGSCCVYQVVIARTLKQLVDGTENISSGGVHIRFYILALLIPCILIAMILTLKYLAPFSIVADFFIVTVAMATVYYGIRAATKSPLEFPVFESVPGLFNFMGVCVFSMEGVGATLAIENNMTHPKKFPLVLAGGMSVVVAMVMVVGFFGYWGFGEKAKSPVTVNFPFEIFPVILKFMMALMVYVTFALNFWIPFELVWHYLQRRHPPERFWIWERVYRAIFVTIITLIAVAFPNVSSFLGLIGSFCLSNMGFIYPAFIELSIDWEYPGLGFMKWRLIKFIVIFIFGCILCVVGTFENLKELIMDVFVR